MKATITSVIFSKEYESKFGTMYLHKVQYDGKTAFYSSKTKDQTFFKKGEDAEFTEEIKQGNNGDFITIKPVRDSFKGNSNYGKALKREQSKYSGFAVSYAKDLVIAGKLEFEELAVYSTVLFDLMVSLDKSIEQ
jgi:hypothetical protein